MNDNEKAATFIGWKPFAQSSWGEWADEHGNHAPDMARAENYIAALEELISRLYCVSFHEGGYDQGDPIVCTLQMSWITGTPEEQRSKPITGASTVSVGLALQAALVALYDAEHEEPA